MTSLWRALVGMLALFTIAVGTLAHAGETAELCLESVSADLAVHGDSDPAPDQEQHGVHAHGGCHGHHQGDLFGNQHSDDLGARAGAPFVHSDIFSPQSLIDPNLRPPIA
ncbi:hypothetical protein [Sphingopyxis sp. MWB1]|uniref:hypothetical protein n=1 Tax=Sphingopyxis sp. MWB1 TaxID=1537715 RepID=UPI000B0C01FB|nr:hypothetical protein [Sphingopyxis sp. MWB1]